MSPRSVILALAALMLVAVPAANAQSTEHNELTIVPAPPGVVIDGDLADWDTSGGIFLFHDLSLGFLEGSAWAYAMHDDANLYFALRVFDKTPLDNTTDPAVSYYGWEGDCLQLRLATDRVTHLTCWWYARGQRPAVHVAYGEKAGAAGQHMVDYQGGVSFAEGVQEAFQALDGPSGYVQELKVPWALITKSGQPPQDDFQALIEVIYGQRVRISDLVKPGTTERTLLHRYPDKWGTARLVAEGHLKQIDPELNDLWQQLDVPQVGGMRDVAFPTNDTVVVAGIHGFLYSADGGAHWQHSNIPAYAVWQMAFPTPQLGYAVGTGGPKYEYKAGVVMGTTDGGQTWNPLAALPSGNLRSIVFGDESHGWIAGKSTKQIFRSANAGKSWPGSNQLPEPTGSGYALSALNATTAFAVASKRYIYRTTNFKTWQIVGDHPEMNFLTIHAFSDGTLWVGAREGLFWSADGGQTLQPIPLPPGYQNVSRIAISPTGLIALRCSIDNTHYVLQSPDGGRSWQPIFEFVRGQTNSSISLGNLAYNGEDLWLVGGGMAGYNQVSQVYRLGAQPIVTTKPAGPVSFSYELPRNVAVTIVIEDEAGNRVRNLISNQPRKAGENTEYWDGRDDRGELMPAGDYRWRGLYHDDLHTYYEFSYYNPGVLRGRLGNHLL